MLVNVEEKAVNETDLATTEFTIKASASAFKLLSKTLYSDKNEAAKKK